MFWLADVFTGTNSHSDYRHRNQEGREGYSSSGHGLYRQVVRRAAPAVAAVRAYQAQRSSRRAIARAIRELKRIDEKMLCDIGLTRSDIPDLARSLVHGRKNATEQSVPIRSDDAPSPGKREQRVADNQESDKDEWPWAA